MDVTAPGWNLGQSWRGFRSAFRLLNVLFITRIPVHFLGGKEREFHLCTFRTRYRFSISLYPGRYTSLYSYRCFVINNRWLLRGSGYAIVKGITGRASERERARAH